MPTYSITAPNGKTLEVTGDHMPNEAELHDIFAKAGVETGSPQPKGQTAPGSTFAEKIKNGVAMLAPAGGGIVGGMTGGVPGAFMGGAAGEGYQQLLDHASELPGAVADVARNLVHQPKATLKGFAQGANQGVTDAATQGAIYGATQGVGEAVTAGVKALPSVTNAGAKFQQVMGAAKNVPVDVEAPGDVALRIQELADRGGSMPKAVRDLLKRYTDPTKAPPTYEEMRDFASNISRLSANEMGRLTPVIQRELANLRVALNSANAQAAETVGQRGVYESAMKEYAQAMKLRDAYDSVLEGAKRSLPYATAAGAGYWVAAKVRSLLGGN